MDGQGNPKHVLSQWADLQKNLYDQWLAAGGEMLKPWADAMDARQEAKTACPVFDPFAKWSEMVQDTVKAAAKTAEAGIGRDVLFRILRSSNLFVLFNRFWLEILKDLPELNQAKSDEAAARKIYERWLVLYKSVFEQIIGSPLCNTAAEIMASWLNTLHLGQSGLGLTWGRWPQAMSEWRKQMEKPAPSLWQEVYEETLGKALRMPGLGLSGEQTERVRRAFDAYFQFWNAVPGFYQFFYKTGTDALKEFFDRLNTFKAEEMTPERLREVYKLWWTTNENALFDLFKRPEFGNAMGEMLSYGLMLKKRLDELTGDWCKSLSIPSREDFDELAKAVHELRRKVRQQQKTIDALMKKAGLSA